MSSTTENGGVAHASTNDACLDLFSSLVRSLDVGDKLPQLLAKAWESDREKTLRIITYLRDCREGLGERRLFYYACAWLWMVNNDNYNANLEYFINHGCYRDLCFLIAIKQVSGFDYNPEVSLFVDALTSSDQMVQATACKWAPSESGRKSWWGVWSSIFVEMIKRGVVSDAKTYRQFITKGRAHLKLIETALCRGVNENTDIDFGAVPSQAMKKYRKLFSKDPLKAKYDQYLAKVKKGEAKMNTKTLSPYQLIAPLMHSNDLSETEVDSINVSWDQFLKDYAQTKLSETVAVVDVSGSMNTCVIPGVTAMSIAVSLGLIVAKVNKILPNQFITFHSDPCVISLKGSTLQENVKEVMDAPWGASTNIVKVFELLLEQATKNREAPQAKSVIIFTDMQFDPVGFQPGSRGEFETSYEHIKNKFRTAGVHLPNIIYWNLAARGCMVAPITVDDRGTALVSGFSGNLLKSIIADGDITPINILDEAIAKYDGVTVVEGGLPISRLGFSLQEVTKFDRIITPITKPKEEKSDEEVDDDFDEEWKLLARFD